MGKYRKKPIEVEAIQYRGWDINAVEILYWIGSHAPHEPHQRLALLDENNTLKIKTLESSDGYHVADVGDWIIRGIAGEFYPCKDSIFQATYEAAE